MPICMQTLAFSDFCGMNGLGGAESLHVLDSAVFPEGPFSGDFTIVLYSTKGISDIKIDSKNYKLRRRCISVWRSGQIIEFRPAEDLQYQLLLISGELQQFLNVGSVFLTLFVTDEYPVIRITSAYNEALVRFFDSISIVNTFEDSPYKRDCLLSILRALFYSTGYYVFKSLRFRDGQLFKFASGNISEENGTVARFIRLVEQKSITERHLNYYAKELDYNPKYLSALVKRETGYSGQSVIDQYSVLTAMARLSYGRRSIKEISHEMNFQSQSDFGKFFKRLTGLSPMNYRKNRFKSV